MAVWPWAVEGIPGPTEQPELALVTWDQLRLQAETARGAWLTRGHRRPRPPGPSVLRAEPHLSLCSVACRQCRGRWGQLSALTSQGVWVLQVDGQHAHRSLGRGILSLPSPLPRRAMAVPLPVGLEPLEGRPLTPVTPVLQGHPALCLGFLCLGACSGDSWGLACSGTQARHPGPCDPSLPVLSPRRCGSGLSLLPATIPVLV